VTELLITVDEWKRPYLIYRMFFKEKVKKDDITGIDSILSGDYMGSAEFEYGAIPKAAEFATTYLPEYKVVETEYKNLEGKHLFLLTPEGLQEKVVQALTSLTKEYGSNGRTTLEYVGLEMAIRGKVEGAFAGGVGYKTPDVWWDIENGWFATFGKPNIKLIQLALTRLREKWLASGRIESYTPEEASP
jgi:hypothetical protein